MPRHCLIHAATTRNKTRPGRPTNEKMKTDNEQEHAEKQMEKNRKTRTRKRMPLLSSLFFSLLLSSSLSSSNPNEHQIPHRNSLTLCSRSPLHSSHFIANRRLSISLFFFVFFSNFFNFFVFINYRLTH